MDLVARDVCLLYLALRSSCVTYAYATRFTKCTWHSLCLMSDLTPQLACAAMLQVDWMPVDSGPDGPELETDIPDFQSPEHGYLLSWAQQGVLLLNATLTVREGHKEANSHASCGWQRFTDEVIKALNEKREGVVFLLWGNFAQKKALG
eukprot:s169_g11.t1